MLLNAPGKKKSTGIIQAHARHVFYDDDEYDLAY